MLWTTHGWSRGRVIVMFEMVERGERAMMVVRSVGV
jgi:hypothetical protein